MLVYSLDDQRYLRFKYVFVFLFQLFSMLFQDVEVYKSLLRDEIDKWMNEMNKHNIIDWVIVVVETYDLRKHSKLLPRTTVFDKIKSDFAEKKADRYVFKHIF